MDAQLIHTATISTRRPSANKARIMSGQFPWVFSFTRSTIFNGGNHSDGAV